MKKLLLAGTSLVFAGSAWAADMPVKAPIAAPVVAYNWTGCSVGGHVGAGWSHTDYSDPGTVAFGALQQNIAPPGRTIGINGGAGFIGGVQAGCDYPFANRWVIGIGGDFSWANIDGRAIDPFFVGKNGGQITLTSKTDEL